MLKGYQRFGPLSPEAGFKVHRGANTFSVLEELRALWGSGRLTVLCLDFLRDESVTYPKARLEELVLACITQHLSFLEAK